MCFVPLSRVLVARIIIVAAVGRVRVRAGGVVGRQVGTYIPVLPLEGVPIALVVQTRAPVAELPKDNLGPDIQGDYIDQVALCTGRDS